jgi:hypothetical protein
LEALELVELNQLLEVQEQQVRLVECLHQAEMVEG